MKAFRAASGKRSAVVGAMTLIAACGDARLEKLSTGIRRDSLLAIITEGSSGDSLARVYRQERYLLDGRMTNILFYSREEVTEREKPELSRDRLTPIVVVNDTVTGWGWAYFDSVAKANNLPSARKE